MMKSKKNTILNWRHEFRDSRLEKEYSENEIKDSLWYVRPIILILGILFFSFIIPDSLLIKETKTLTTILLIRGAVFLSILLLYIITKSENYLSFFNLFSVYEVAVSLSFFVICYNYEDPNFLIQTFGTITIIIAVFIIPNRWINKIITSFAISAEFFILSLYIFHNIKFSEFSAAVVYTGLISILVCINTYNIEYYKRKQYLNNQRLKHLSSTDPMTGLFNRATLNKEIARCISIYHETSHPFSLVIFDVDNFKGINDKYGHPVGDNVLLDIVGIVKNRIREYDMFFRWGGEEFILLLTNTSRQQAYSLVENLRKMIDDFSFKNNEHVTCSFGIAGYEEEDDIDSLLARCDRNLYVAKGKGKNKVEY